MTKLGRRKMDLERKFPRELLKKLDTKFDESISSSAQTDNIVKILKDNNASKDTINAVKENLGTSTLKGGIMSIFLSTDYRTQSFKAIEVVAEMYLKGEL